MDTFKRWMARGLWAITLVVSAAAVHPALLGAQPPAAPLSIEAYMALIAESGIPFEAYETGNVWNESNQPPILDTAFKRDFKTRLTDAATWEPNFDGKYVIVPWGCGTECEHFAIIDVETGVVTDGLTTRWGQNFQADSSLIVVNDPALFFEESGEVWLPEMFYTKYYRWDGEKLVLLKTLERQPQ